MSPKGHRRGDTVDGVSHRLMLPDANYQPPRFVKFPIHDLVAFHVAI